MYVLRGKIWAYRDAIRRASKRQKDLSERKKDLAGIARLIEAHPPLVPAVPEVIRQRLG